jgi:hypothetical protein
MLEEGMITQDQAIEIAGVAVSHMIGRAAA